MRWPLPRGVFPYVVKSRELSEKEMQELSLWFVEHDLKHGGNIRIEPHFTVSMVTGNTTYNYKCKFADSGQAMLFKLTWG